MSRKEKLIRRLLSNPKDFTIEEMDALMGYMGYIKKNKGKTSGSRVSYEKEGKKIYMHKPHPANVIKRCYLKEIIKRLEEEGLL